MINVLHTIHVTGPGGAETVCLDLARGLDPVRWRSFVTIPDRGWIYQPLIDAGIQPILLPTDGRMGYFLGLLEIVRRRKIRLIQAHLLGPSVNASLVGIVAGVPVISTFHGHSDVCLDGALRDSVRHAIVRRGAARAVFVSDPLRRFYLERGCNREERTAVIVNGIDTQRFRPERDHSFRRELGFSGDHIVVGTIANLRAAKDYPVFLRAAALLAARSARYRFVAVGDDRGPLLSELLVMRDAFGLKDKVIFTGFRDDAERILSSLDVFVITSKVEGFSLATVQAMAAGVPVVATRCGGPEAILEDGQTGLLVDVGAPVQIADAVERVSHRGRLRDQLVSRALCRAREDFSVESMVRQYEILYDRAIG